MQDFLYSKADSTSSFMFTADSRKDIPVGAF